MNLVIFVNSVFKIVDGGRLWLFKGHCGQLVCVELKAFQIFNVDVVEGI